MGVNYPPILLIHMKYSIRIKSDNLFPIAMLISVAVLDLLVLMVSILQQLAGVIFLSLFLVLALLWIPPTVIILFFIFFELNIFVSTRSKLKPTSKTFEIFQINLPFTKHTHWTAQLLPRAARILMSQVSRCRVLLPAISRTGIQATVSLRLLFPLTQKTGWKVICITNKNRGEPIYFNSFNPYPMRKENENRAGSQTTRPFLFGPFHSILWHLPAPAYIAQSVTPLSIL